MNIETVKVPVSQLAIGMQVVKLDRSWLETPFKLQGFRIETTAELRTLEKYCRLDAREVEIMQLHVRYGIEMSASLSGLSTGSVEVIAAHHERFNGSGYPAGLQGGEIPLLGRIARLVDSFDAITSERGYADPILVGDAIKEMYAATVDVFQRGLVERLIQVLGTYPVGSLVELSDGSIALVASLNRERQLLPQVILLTDTNQRPNDALQFVDLAAESGPALTVRDIVEPDALGIPRPSVSVVSL